MKLRAKTPSVNGSGSASAGQLSHPTATRRAPVPQVLNSGVPNRALSIDDLAQFLVADIPQGAWVVIIDGRSDDEVASLCRKVSDTRPQSKFWLVGHGSDAGTNSLSTSVNLVRLNLDKPADKQFADILVPDLVIVTSQATDAQEQRVHRWVNRCYYLVIERPTAVLLEDIANADSVSRQYRAPVFLMEGQSLSFLG